MKKFIIIVIALFASFNSLYLKGQQITYPVANENVREKVELITDRNLYLSGENIWFSAVIKLNVSDSLRQLSNVLYIEVYSHDQAVIQKKYQILNGKVQGMIPIPEELPSANYYLRAYTRYQRNFPPESYFTSLLTIINPENPVKRLEQQNDKWINMMPEGGKMVNGLPARLAVKIHPGIVKKISNSFIKDQYHNIIDTISFFANGIALVEFIPIDSLDYTLVLSLKSGDTLNEPLPAVSHSGLIIGFNPKDQKVNLYASTEYLEKNAPEHKLLILSGGLSGNLIPVEITDTLQNFSIDSFIDKEGIYFVGIQNEKGDIVSYTSLFSTPGIVNPEPKTQKDKFRTREAVSLNMKMYKQDQKNLEYLTISVIKKREEFISEPNLPESVIVNPGLLPAMSYSLDLISESISKQIRAALILGRNSFNYSLLQNDEMNKWLAETRDVSISGIVRNARNKKPLADKWVYASVLGENPQFHAYRSRLDGLFVFSLNKLKNNQEVSLSIDSIPDVDVEFLIYNDFSDKWPVAKDVPLHVDSTQKELLREMWINYQVEKIFKSKINVKEVGIDSIPFPFSDVKESIKLDNYVSLPTMTEVINELVPFVNVRKRKGKYLINIVDETKQNTFKDPLILVDNLPVYDVDKILSINPAKVEQIDMIDKIYNFGDLTIKGILMIHTNTDDFAGMKLPSSSVFIDYMTITPSADIRFPVYNPNNNETGHNPDFKNLLYWNPSVDVSENSTITFYAADELTDYEIILRGQLKDGRIVFGKHKISVSRY